MTDADSLDALTARVRGLMPDLVDDLKRLVRIPSINFPGYDTADVRACADMCVELLRAAGAPTVDLVESRTGIPTVHAEIPGPPGAPTVMLYAHYDVQPAGDESAWLSPPFEPTVRDGRLYGRGAADDKSGVALHLASIRAFEGRPPVNLRIYLEGEEEYGGAFEEWPFEKPEAFEGVSAMVIADVGNLRIGEPTFTTALRGIVDGVVEVRTLEGPVHSGMFGGPAPDALMVLIRILDSLQTASGDCAVPGMGGSPWVGGEFPESAYRETAGVVDGVPLVGSGSVADRLFSMPSVNVVGLDAPAVDTAPNALVPVARAKVSVRIPPGVDPDAGLVALEEYLQAQAPYGIAVSFTPGRPASGVSIPTDGPAYAAATSAMEAAYGRDVQRIGAGGSIPFVANLAEALPGVEVLLFGAQDPLARIHAPNESVDLDELEHAALAQALFLEEYARHH
ncbi:MAG: M20/M25/M40 family metallo-hydrolase [Candidatus Nanopelagicales bacterium]